MSGPSGRGGTAVGGPPEPLLERGPRCCRQPHSGGRRPRLRGPWGGVTAHCLGVGGPWCLWEGSVEELLACRCPRGGDSGCSHSAGEEGRRGFADVLRIQRRERTGNPGARQRAAAFPARGFAKAATGWPRWGSVCPHTWMHRGRPPAPGRGGLCEDRPRRGLRHSQRRVRASRAATIWECNCDSRKRTLQVPGQTSLSPPKAWCRGFAGRAHCRFTFGHGVPALAPRRNPRGGVPDTAAWGHVPAPRQHLLAVDPAGRALVSVPSLWCCAQTDSGPHCPAGPHPRPVPSSGLQQRSRGQLHRRAGREGVASDPRRQPGGQAGPCRRHPPGPSLAARRPKSSVCGWSTRVTCSDGTTRRSGRVAAVLH